MATANTNSSMKDGFLRVGAIEWLAARFTDVGVNVQITNTAVSFDFFKNTN
jgi:hypothetical protein